jgi:hypothetical protein
METDDYLRAVSSIRLKSAHPWGTIGEKKGQSTSPHRFEFQTLFTPLFPFPNNKTPTVGMILRPSVPPSLLLPGKQK